MNKKQFEKLLPEPNDISKKIKKAATYIVDNEWTAYGEPLTGDLRETVLTATCASMVLGEKLSRGRYLRRGFCSGVLVTVGSIMILQTIDWVKKPEGKHEKRESR